jgi:hypothetical protein
VKKVSWPILFTLIIIAPIPAVGGSVPGANIALSINHEISPESFDSRRLSGALEKELRKKGYLGSIREIQAASYTPCRGESLVCITVMKSRWETKKAFSIPYFLNRYKKAYSLKVFVEIPGSRDRAVSKTFAAGETSGVQAQFIQNDRYDPDLLLDQTERISLEEKVCAKMAGQLSGYLSKNLD